MPLVAVLASLLATKASSKFAGAVSPAYTATMLILNGLLLLIGFSLALSGTPEPSYITAASLLVTGVSVAVYLLVRFRVLRQSATNTDFIW
jgi:hypothetical protein